MKLQEEPFDVDCLSVNLPIIDAPLATAPNEMRWLIAEAGKTKGNIVEIGTFLGVTALGLASNHPKKLVYMVDYHDPNQIHGPAQQISEYMRPEKIGSYARHLPNVFLTLTKSQCFDFTPTEAGLIFVDGGHSFAQVAADTISVMQYHARHPANRTIVWHDYYPNGDHQDWAGVNAFLEALATKVPVFNVAGTILAVSRWTPETQFLTP